MGAARRLVARYAEPLFGEPRHLFRPQWYTPKGDEWLQNTDPFVWGECFRYSNCRQCKNGKPTKMQRLASGSLILFGSSLGKQFVLDTVFVVASGIAFDEPESVRHLVSDAFAAITLERIPRQTHRLYEGATFDHPIDGMYSFFPCMSSSNAPRGFPRPVLSLPSIVNGQLAMNFRAVEQQDVDAVEAIWEETIRQVREHGLDLGVAAMLPERRARGS